MIFNVNEMKGNQDLDTIEHIKGVGIPVVVLGGGDVGRQVCAKLYKYGVKDVYVAVSEGYEVEGCYVSTDIDKILDAYILVPAFQEAYLSEKSSFNEYKNKKDIFYLYDLYCNAAEPIDKEFFLLHQDKFEEVFNALADEKSKQCMTEFLRAKLTDNASGFRGLVERPQYFSGDFIKLSSEEVLVDCGAYNGDSIRDFLKTTNGRYNGIYAFEPDEINLKELKAYVSDNNLRNVNVCPYGAYDCATELHFSGNGGVYSRIDECSELIIKTETIDNVLNGQRVSFIKMDIEGSEVKALMGAQNSIKKYSPVLAISAYHKADDIYEIYRVINELSKEYKFYFRLHKAFTVDAVLYAVPLERRVC